VDADKAAIMRGKIILVTGATSGIGLETARELASLGAHVLVGARDLPRGQAVVDDLSRRGYAAELLPIDLASWDSVRGAAARFASAQSRLDVLVNNAATVTRDRQITPDGHERIWGTNFLGAFLLTRLLIPKLHAASQPRVVNVSSNAHFGGRINWDDLELSHGFTGLRAYSNSKLALVLFTRELARREPRLGVNAVHPGVIATRIWRAAPAPIVWLLRLVLPSAEKGARPVVRLAAAPELEGVSGRYFDRFREGEPAPAARSASDAARLWEIAERATGLS
jgi:NAD(P)-dependent dehydrogenase (short-subunit alcohol dehydrogenase family)